jgi:predicted hydrocarbon binding protein
MLPGRLFRLFLESTTHEVGMDKLPALLAENHLSPAILDTTPLDRLDGAQAAMASASLQQVLRLYYGRGARGILLRIGQGMWDCMLAQAGFLEKAELEIVRRLPIPARWRRMLELVAARLRESGSATSVHSLDFELILVDHGGAATVGQSSAEPICFVTIGLIKGALCWATGQVADVEEIACKAAGATACEFKIKLGGK